MSYLTSTYTGTDVSSYVKRQFGDESGVQITDEDIVHWINAGVMRFSEKRAGQGDCSDRRYCRR